MLNKKNYVGIFLLACSVNITVRQVHGLTKIVCISLCVVNYKTRFIHCCQLLFSGNLSNEQLRRVTLLFVACERDQL